MATKKKPEPDVIDSPDAPIPEPIHEPLPDPEPEPPTLFDTVGEVVPDVEPAPTVPPIEGTGVRVYPAIRPAMMAHSTPVEPPTPVPAPAPPAPAPAPPAPAPAPAAAPPAPAPAAPAPNFASAEVVRLVLVIANTPPTVAELGQVMEWAAPTCCEAIAAVMRGKVPVAAKIVALRANQSVSAIVYTAKV